ncbi:hypothetical protein E1180_00215, partial [Roseibium denhamense]|nr:hypothetical protein [Roseibium denhamense]
MNTDQGSQFTSFAWTDQLRRMGVRISMDGKGRFLDNIFIERLWRTLKYECVYLHAWETDVRVLKATISTIIPRLPRLPNKDLFSGSVDIFRKTWADHHYANALLLSAADRQGHLACE